MSERASGDGPGGAGSGPSGGGDAGGGAGGAVGGERAPGMETTVASDEAAGTIAAADAPGAGSPGDAGAVRPVPTTAPLSGRDRPGGVRGAGDRFDGAGAVDGRQDARGPARGAALRVGRYELGDELGAGGMAAVYRARDARLRRDVAVKVLFPHLAKRREVVARFQREARAAAALDHPNILRVHDVGGDGDDPPYIVMELVEGESLRELIARQQPPPAEVVACAGVVLCGALGAAHAAGIVHRDVKPANIMIAADGRLALADFGVARVDDDDSSLVTRTGALVGTPAFMSPEQAVGNRSDARSDLYSLGATLYQLATGALPYAGPTAKVMTAIIAGDHVPPLRRDPAIGPDLARAIERLMATEPAVRFPDAGEAAGALREVAAAGGTGEPEAEWRAWYDDPDGYRAERLPAIVTATLDRARREVSARRISRALALVDRVLALDPDNREAVALIDAVGSRRRARWLVAAAAVAVAAAGSAWAVWSRSPAGPVAAVASIHAGDAGGPGDALAGAADGADGHPGADAGVRQADSAAGRTMVTGPALARSADQGGAGLGPARSPGGEPDGTRPGRDAGSRTRGATRAGASRARGSPPPARGVAGADPADRAGGAARPEAAGPGPTGNDRSADARDRAGAQVPAPSRDGAGDPAADVDPGQPPGAAGDRSRDGAPARPTPAPARVTFDLRPWCDLRIDGVDHGRARADRAIELAPGTHAVTCSQGPGRPEWRRDITLAPGERLTLTGRVLAPVRVRIAIPGGVEIDGRPAADGATVALTPGRHRVGVPARPDRSAWVSIPAVAACTLRLDPALDCYR